MKLKIMTKLGFAAERGLAPHIRDLYDRDDFTLVCIAEIGGAVNEVVRRQGAGEDAVKVQLLTMEPASPENAERLRAVARALRAMRNPQGELFGDMDVELAADTLKHFADMVGFEEAARVILGVRKYVGMLDDMLAKSPAALKPEEMRDTVGLAVMGLQAVLEGARLPDDPELDGQLDLRDGSGLWMGETRSGKTDAGLVEEAERAARADAGREPTPEEIADGVDEAGYDGPMEPDAGDQQ